MSNHYTCPHCTFVSANPLDIRHSWCGQCHRFGWATEEEPIQLNLIVGEFQEKVRYDLGQGAPFSLQLEQFMGEGFVLHWRALIKVGKRVWRTTSRPHVTPTEALRELSELAGEEHGSRLDW